MSDPETTVPSVDPEELYRRLAAGERPALLDVRDRDEFERWHVEGAVQAPYPTFVAAGVRGEVAELAAELGLEGPVVAVCARGEASEEVAGLLRGAGVEAANLASGMEGWARVYVARDLPHDGPATVRQYLRPSSGCLAYLVHDGAEAAVVDPLRAFAERYVEDAAELGVEIAHAVDTHVHADHLSGVRDLAELAGAEPVLPAKARDRGLAFDATPLDDGDVLRVGDATVEALPVPGHTAEMTALLVDGSLVLSGDSLFVESVARPDLERGDEGARDLAAALHGSLGRLLDLPDGTVVAPGHIGPGAEPADDGSYWATVGELEGRLDLLGLDREAFVDRVAGDLPPRPANFEAIVEVNLGRHEVGEDEGFEMELGPNNCAVS